MSASRADMAGSGPGTPRREHFPRVALWGAATVITLSIVLAAAGRQQTVSPTPLRDTFDLTAPVKVAIGFEDRNDGAVVVRDADSTAVVSTLAPGTNGFVRGVMRGLARERRLHGFDHTAPFELARWPDGHYTLDDTATGRHIELAPFGNTNQAAFGALWIAARRADSARRTTTAVGGDSHAEFSAAESH